MGREQWVAETGIAVPPTPVFLSKSAQMIENKGRECEKERKERQRVRKSIGVKELAWSGGNRGGVSVELT